MKQVSRKAILTGAAALGIVFGAAGVAAASESAQTAPTHGEVEEAGDVDIPLTGTDFDNAVAVALDHVGEGEVNETEVGDDGAAFEVEILLTDGRQIEVNLDADFNVIGSEVDDN